ncbi:hypothetical protein [Flavihumibacter fluvii]|uniref:hypothetical protein n=1 Tax=Flavihumibacter fluvii TaxID=2838157 RepID=UPI001BDF0F70|nr:hypothetical protein [Flavihumibacter fluvii]ULQ50801.1 hypothetical protein KJS93_11975 [Flavihumibacter fluvii]
MKKFLTTLTMAICLHVAMAQDSSRHHWKSLNLTEDQQNKMAALHKEHRAKMMAILTPEQRKQFDQQKADMKVKRAEKSKARMEKMKKQLKLTDEQSEKITRLNQEFRQKTELIRANETLAAAEQRKQLKALVDAHQTEMKAMLDPGQQSILEEMKTRRHKPMGR